MPPIRHEAHKSRHDPLGCPPQRLVRLSQPSEIKLDGLVIQLPDNVLATKCKLVRRGFSVEIKVDSPVIDLTTHGEPQWSSVEDISDVSLHEQLNFNEILIELDPDKLQAVKHHKTCFSFVVDISVIITTDDESAVHCSSCSQPVHSGYILEGCGCVR